MKKQIASFVIIAGLLVVPVGVLAQDDGTDTTTDVDETSVIENIKNDGVLELRYFLADRLEDKKAEIAQKLTAQREALLARKCVSVQNKLQAVLNSAGGPYRNRVAVYNRLIERLEAILSRFEANHETIDSSDLRTNIDNLKTMVDEFQTKFEGYLLTIDDAVNEKACADDPTRFHEFFETAREMRAELKSDSAAIRQQFANQIKSILNNYKSQLADEEPAA